MSAFSGACWSEAEIPVIGAAWVFHAHFQIRVAGLSFILVFAVAATAMGEEGAPMMYQVNGESYEGYYISPSNKAPLVVLIHDWDGLTDYEVKRAHMLAEAGHARFSRFSHHHGSVCSIDQ